MQGTDVIETPAAAPVAQPFRDADGDIERAFVDRVEAAITAGQIDALRALTEDLHESDLGALIEALPHDDRPRLIELLGRDFDFTALTEVDDSVREDILEELETETVAEGVQDLNSDDAVTNSRIAGSVRSGAGAGAASGYRTHRHPAQPRL